jgi:hypothetical protein
MTNTEYYVGGRPFSGEEGFEFRDGLISFLDGATSQLLTSTAKSWPFKIFISFFGPGYVANEINLKINDDDTVTFEFQDIVANGVVTGITEAVEIFATSVAGRLAAQYGAQLISGIGIQAAAIGVVAVPAAMLYNKWLSQPLYEEWEEFRGTVDKELTLISGGNVIAGVKYKDGFGSLSEADAIRDFIEYAKSRDDMPDVSDGMAFNLYTYEDVTKTYAVFDQGFYARVAEALGQSENVIKGWQAIDANGLAAQNSDVVISINEFEVFDTKAKISFLLPQGERIAKSFATEMFSG